MSRSDQLKAEGEALLQKKSFFGKNKNILQAADKFKQAGNSYKIDRNWAQAGECHMKSAQLLLQHKETPAAIDEAIEAGRCFEKDPTLVDKTVEAYKFASTQLKENPRKQYDAGECLISAGNALLTTNRVDEGMELLEQAIAIFQDTSDSSASVAKNFERLGDLLTEKKQYNKAVEFYQKVVDIRLSNQVTQGSAPGVFFKAMLAYLQLNDIIGARKMLDEFIRKNPVFRNDFHNKFLQDLLNNLDAHDAKGFNDTVSTFQRQKSVDKWTKDRIEGLRQFVGEAGEDDEGIL